MVISIHLPPPVMIEGAATFALVTHMLCCSWAMCFSAAASSENDQGSMNLASNTASGSLTNPSSVAAKKRCTGLLNPALNVGDGPSRVALVPGPVERLGGDAELDDQIVAQILRLGRSRPIVTPQRSAPCASKSDSGALGPLR